MTETNSPENRCKSVQSAAPLVSRLKWLRLLLLPVAFILASCRPAKPPQTDNRIEIKYWDKWVGFEADAMRAVVDDFNASQHRIRVDYSSVSQIDRKLMLATSGGVPPDVAGIYSNNLPVYAENNALLPLDKLAAKAGITRGQYIDIFWINCSYRGHLWALPSTPSSIGLIWNKKLFREAGLDPERPPRSIAELEEYNKKLTRYGPDGTLEVVGHLPEEPGWWKATWGFWFGGELWDGDRTITADSPANIAAYRWVQSYPERFGANNLLNFRDGFGNFASPQNPFFNGRVAMVMQGVWIYNFIKNYAPADFEWGVAAFPSSDPEHLKDVTIAECDDLVIPNGSKHPAEAFEFIKYVNSQKPMEKLCMGQLKFSPLRECSPEFLRNHPNPHIKTFLDLAKSPNAHTLPQTTIWNQYQNDMGNAVSWIWAGKATAEEALHDVQTREQPLLDRRRERWDRVAAKLMAEWDSK